MVKPKDLLPRAGSGALVGRGDASVLYWIKAGILDPEVIEGKYQIPAWQLAIAAVHTFRNCRRNQKPEFITSPCGVALDKFHDTLLAWANGPGDRDMPEYPKDLCGPNLQ